MKHLRQKPIIGTFLGIGFGLLLGLAAVWYFRDSDYFDAFTVVAISVLSFQLFGAIVGGAIGRSHLQVGSTRPRPDENNLGAG